jgi:hypothetical protein
MMFFIFENLKLFKRLIYNVEFEYNFGMKESLYILYIGEILGSKKYSVIN